MPNKQDLLSHSHLLDVLIYDPETGWFWWRRSRKGVPRNKELFAGATNKAGYRQIMLGKRMYLAHRLAWFYMHREWPTEQIDHINGIRTDNRLINLREATQSQQSANSAMQSTNLTGYKGVTFCAGKYTAQIGHKGQYFYLGRYDTPEEAHQAYLQAAKQLHGDYARLTLSVARR